MLNTGLFRVSLHSATTLSEAFELWLSSMEARGYSPTTVNGYRWNVGLFIRFLHERGLRTLDEVQPEHIRAWLLERRKQGISNAQLHNSFRQPRVWWNWLLKQELVHENPFQRVEPPKRIPRIRPALSIAQVEQLLDACKGSHWLMKRDYALILMLADTGLRISEAHSMRVSDAKRDCLFIRGKGGKQRAVFLSPEVRIALKRYLSSVPYPLSDDSPLWHGARGPLSWHGMKEAVQAVGRRAGIYPLGPHALRRTFCVQALRNGIDLERLRQLVGHSGYEVLRAYLPLVSDDLQQAHAQYSPIRNLRLRSLRK